MDQKEQNFAAAEMMIRRPVAEVFEAFVNPEITTKFWFSRSSGRLEEGKRIEWTWEYYNISAPVFVRTIIPREKIVVVEEDHTLIEWNFKPLDESKTFISVTHRFAGSTKNVIQKVRDSTGGFTMVLAALKAYLEHNIQLRLVEDKLPRELMS